MKQLPIMVLTILLTLGLTACEKGPAEKAGERMDDAMESTVDDLEEKRDAVDEALDTP